MNKICRSGGPSIINLSSNYNGCANRVLSYWLRSRNYSKVLMTLIRTLEFHCHICFVSGSSPQILALFNKANSHLKKLRIFVKIVELGITWICFKTICIKLRTLSGSLRFYCETIP